MSPLTPGILWRVLPIALVAAGCTVDIDRLRRWVEDAATDTVVLNPAIGDTIAGKAGGQSGSAVGSATGMGGLSGGGGGYGTGGTPGSGETTLGDGGTGDGGFPSTGGTTTVTCTPACDATSDCIGGSCTPRLSMACATAQDCPASATCCDGSEETCDGTRVPTGEGPSEGRFQVSADGVTVTDTITGLAWQRDGSGARLGCKGSLSCTWAEAKDYCAGLTLGGLKGWRLPARKELLTLVDYTQSSPAIDRGSFPNTSSDNYWTASRLAGSAGAWYIAFGSGHSSYNGLNGGAKVRCVRGSRCYPKARFMVLPGGLVRDTLTALVWQQDTSGQRAGTGCDGSRCTGSGAMSYCAGLILAGQSGFRVPTVKELESLVDLAVTPPETAINQVTFPGTTGDGFWASTSTNSANAWLVTFNPGLLHNAGYVGPSVMTQSNYVRCVR